MSELTTTAVRNLLESKKWTFARSMPQIPHFYSLRKNWGTDTRFFFDVCRFIREHGVTEYFGKRAYTYLYLDGFKYWTMDERIEDTALINRAVAEDGTAYKRMAKKYDDVYNNDASRAEEDALLTELALDVPLLDIGCGTGVLVDAIERSVHRDRFSILDYTGIDISQPMIDVFRRKHPRWGARAICTPFESYVGYGFGCVVALFGVASYLSPEGLTEHITNLLQPGGVAYLMYYRPGYIPRNYEELGCDPPDFEYAPENMNPVRWHQYDIVTIHRSETQGI